MEVGGGEEGGGKGRGGEDFFQIAALIEQLRHNDLDYRVNATKHLCTISRALGEERTREELIPFIMDSTDDEDEVLLAMAEALGDLVDCLGGPEHVHQLLVPLEALTACEEGVVRERAVESILKVGTAMSREAKGDHLLPFLRRLADRDWFTTRMSATALFEHVYR
jgi:serine/threonine-protein phosphatase 2A regulatory subunit A